MKRYFITATGTDSGKTFLTCALTWQLRLRGLRVQALKPVASGVTQDLQSSDAGQLLAAQEMPISSINQICPWRFCAPLSPDMAARKEGVLFSFDDLITFCNTPSDADIQLVEGVGGVMSPITDKHTLLDWMEALSIPTILVAGSYVGSISHTLSALQALHSRGLNVHCIILNESINSAANLLETAESLKAHMQQKVSVHTLQRLDSTPEVWKNAPNLSEGLL